MFFRPGRMRARLAERRWRARLHASSRRGGANDLAANARCIGELFIDRLRRMQGKYPRVVREVRGLGLMIGIEFQPTFGPLPENKNPLQFKLWTDCMKKVS